jgi:hypothetical protein
LSSRSPTDVTLSSLTRNPKTESRNPKAWDRIRRGSSASPELVGFGRGAYGRRSERTSRLLGQLFEALQGEGFTMAYTMEDFERDYFLDHFPKLTLEEQCKALQRLWPKQRRELLHSLPVEWLASVPAEERLAGLPPEQIRHYSANARRTGHLPTWCTGMGPWC